MAYSYVRFTGNGSTTNFAFSFPYLSRSHISVRVNDVITSYTFLNDSTVTVSPAPAAGTVVEVRRTTPKDTPIVNFTDGSVLLEADLDLLATYNLYVAQEAFDSNDLSIQENYLGQFDAENKRIINVADPTAAQDAATKAYADTKVAKSGDTMTGLLAMSGFRITGVGDPVNPQDAATKSWAETATTSILNQTQAVLNEFKSIYHGPRATAPTSNVSVGDLWFDTGVSPNVMRVWNGSIWQGSTSLLGASRQVFVATAGQTVFTVTSGYDSNQVDVFLNGVKLVKGDDFTAADGHDIVLTTGANLNDVLEVIAMVAFLVTEPNLVTRAEFTGNGSTTTFNTGRALATVASVNVSINGVVQRGSSYTVSGTNIVFSEAPPVTSKIDVLIFGG